MIIKNGGLTMKKTRSTWRFVMKIVGLSLAAAGLICLVIGYWDKLMVCGTTLCDKCRGKRDYSEFDDYNDELLYED